MENLILCFFGMFMFGYFIYKITKIGMLDDAINFIKYEIFNKKR